MKSFRILQLNIERDKHVTRILPFLDKEQFDAICLEEVLEPDALRFKERYGLNLHFTPRELHSGVAEGLAVFSPHLLTNERALHYAGASELCEGVIVGSAAEKSARQRYLIAFADIRMGDTIFRLGATHFPWTPDGSADDFQRAAMTAMLEILRKEEGFILCGDFNAPRGGEIWDRLAAPYRDNIPKHYTWSLDQELHRAPIEEREKMVDGIFSTSGYVITNVERICGLSDHCGFMGEVSLPMPHHV